MGPQACQTPRRRGSLLLVVALGSALATSMTASAAASRHQSDPLRRPLHLPHLRPHQRCPTSPSRSAPRSWSSQTLYGRGPVYLVGVLGVRGKTIQVDFSTSDRLGWSGEKTPWAVSRSYDGPFLVRGARIDRKGQMRFAYGYGDHLKELRWEAESDYGSPPDPNFRLLAGRRSFARRAATPTRSTARRSARSSSSPSCGKTSATYAGVCRGGRSDRASPRAAR